MCWSTSSPLEVDEFAKPKNSQLYLGVFAFYLRPNKGATQEFYVIGFDKQSPIFLKRINDMAYMNRDTFVEVFDEYKSLRIIRSGEFLTLSCSTKLVAGMEKAADTHALSLLRAWQSKFGI